MRWRRREEGKDWLPSFLEMEERRRSDALGGRDGVNGDACPLVTLVSSFSPLAVWGFYDDLYWEPLSNSLLYPFFCATVYLFMLPFWFIVRDSFFFFLNTVAYDALRCLPYCAVMCTLRAWWICLEMLLWILSLNWMLCVILNWMKFLSSSWMLYTRFRCPMMFYWGFLGLRCYGFEFDRHGEFASSKVVIFSGYG